MDDTARPNSLSRRDSRVVLHPYSDAVAIERDGPLVVTKGKGVTVTDEDGKTYIEGMAGLWNVSLGFGEERLARAAAEQIRTLSFYHGFTARSHPPQIELAERLLGLAPVPMSRVFFASSGSEANDTAVKLIWYFNNARGKPEKKKIIARDRAYHGVTVAAASLSGLPHVHAAFDLPLPGFLHTACPHYARNAEPGESEADFATRMADTLEALIQAEGPETVAAFIAEPVMGAGGLIFPPEAYFEKIQAVLDRHDVLLVADEVICGFGRTGRMWGSETYGMRPDIVTCAKALSSGYQPISAVLITDEIFRAIADQSHEIGQFGHGYTYSGHPVPAAVALETLKIYEEIDLIGRIREVAPALQEGIRCFADHPLIGEVAGEGMLAVAELVADKTARTPFDRALGVGGRLNEFARAHGLLLRPLGDRIGFAPPLVITPEEIEEMFARFGRALDDTAEWLVAQNTAHNG